jgi:hypothetical protein
MPADRRGPSLALEEEIKKIVFNLRWSCIRMFVIFICFFFMLLSKVPYVFGTILERGRAREIKGETVNKCFISMYILSLYLYILNKK